MKCPSDEKIVEFLTEEKLQDEVMGKKEFTAIKNHISRCPTCQKKKEEYSKFFKKIEAATPRIKKKLERERRRNGN